MFITYLRSSSYNAHRLCPQQFFGEYVLGWKGPSSLAADKGTIVHKILEIIAVTKVAKQNREKYIIDNICGKLSVGYFDINDIIDKVFGYYSDRIEHHSWNERDFKDCKDWVWKALRYGEGAFDPRKKKVVAAEPHFDFPIEKPWAVYDYTVKGEKIEGLLSIKGTIDLITEVNPTTYEVIDWKGLPTSTEIPTPQGWTTMGDLLVEDKVFDIDGNITTIIGKSQANYKECYKITFDDTTTVICDNEHLWNLDDNTVVHILDLKINDKINTAKPLQCIEVELPIDPYILGVWLGKGRNANGEIASGDSFVYDEIINRKYLLGENINKTNSCPSRTIYGLRTQLRKLNLLHNKHIPAIYLRASYSQRLDLLRGLMDTDGNANLIRKQAVFTTISKTLSNDVKELLLSLGQRPNQANITKKYLNRTIKVYPLHFRPVNINPFLLPRKAKQISTEWGNGKSHKRRVTKIEKLSVMQNTQCIMVDSPSNTYLCTKNMIPTHNSGKYRKDWATGETKTHSSFRQDPQLRMYHLATHMLYPHLEHVIVTIFYINAGGPFTICFDKEELSDTENMIREKYEEIKNDEKPQLLWDNKPDDRWKCTRLCSQGKTTFEDTNVKPMVEYREGHRTPVGQVMCKCEQVKYCLERRPMQAVIDNMSAPDYKITDYKDPGDV